MGKSDILIKFLGQDLVTDILKQMSKQASETKKATEEVTRPLETVNPTGINKINSMLKGIAEKASTTGSSVTESLSKISNIDFSKGSSKAKSFFEKIATDAKSGTDVVVNKLSNINNIVFDKLRSNFKTAIEQMTSDAKSGSDSIGSSLGGVSSGADALLAGGAGFLGMNNLFEEMKSRGRMNYLLSNKHGSQEANAITNEFIRYDAASSRPDHDLVKMMGYLATQDDLNSKNTYYALSILDGISSGGADDMQQRSLMQGFGRYIQSGWDGAAQRFRDEGLTEEHESWLKSAKTFDERIKAVEKVGLDMGYLNKDKHTGMVVGASTETEGMAGATNRIETLKDLLIQKALNSFMRLIYAVDPVTSMFIRIMNSGFGDYIGFAVVTLGSLAILGATFRIATEVVNGFKSALNTAKSAAGGVKSFFDRLRGVPKPDTGKGSFSSKTINANKVTIYGKQISDRSGRNDSKGPSTRDPNYQQKTNNNNIPPTNNGGKKGVGARIKQKFKSITGTITSGANNASKKVKNTANSASSFITSKFSGAGNRVKNTLNGVGTTAGAMGTKIKSGATRGIGGLKNLGGTLKTQIIGGFKSAGGVIKTAISNLRNFSGAAVTARARSIALGAAEKLRGVWTAITTGITKGATIAQRALNLALSANPIGAVITVVMILVGALIYLWTTNEGFRKAVINGWNAIRNGVQSAIHIIMGGLDWLIGGLNAVLTPLRQIWCMVMGCSPGLIPAFKKFGNVVPGDINKVGSSLKGLHNKMSKMPESLEMNATASSKIDKSVMKNKNKKGSSNGGSGDSKDGGDVHYHKHENTFEFKDKSKEEVKKILIEIFEDGDKTPMI